MTPCKKRGSRFPLADNRLAFRIPRDHAEDSVTEVPNRALVVYALAALGGESRRIHTEDVAVKCHELFPESFSWTKYTHLPDKDIVRVALTDARKTQWGALVDGRAGEKRGQTAKTKRDPALDGWMLTANGLRWLQQNRDMLEARLGTGDLRAHRQRVLKQLAKIKSHSLYLAYLDDPVSFSPSIGDVADFLRCRVDAPEDVWARRFEAHERQASAIDEAGVTDFLAKCRSAYLTER